jgi:cytochrome c-type biogenesis protein CcmH/NrfF
MALIWILLMMGDFVKYKFPVKVIRIVLWIFVLVFALNTVGNIFAKTLLEKAFTLLTLGTALAIGFVLRRPVE